MNMLARVASVVLLLACSVQARAQYPEPSPGELCAAYAALTSLPDSVNQHRFFSAFPEQGEYFTLLYGDNPQLRGSGYDLHPVCFEHIRAFWNLPLVPDSVFMEKAVRITCGLKFGMGAAWYWQWYLRDAFRRAERVRGILDEVSRLRRGHQMEFWGFLWSAANADDRDLLYERNRECIREHYPQTADISDRAFFLFHNGIRLMRMPR